MSKCQEVVTVLKCFWPKFDNHLWQFDWQANSNNFGDISRVAWEQRWANSKHLPEIMLTASEVL